MTVRVEPTAPGTHGADAPPAARGIGSQAALVGGILFSAAFTGLIWLAGTYWLDAPLVTPDRPGMWYQWQRLEPTVLSRATAWGGYLAHQLTLWFIIWRAQRSRPGYTTGLHRFNIAALAATAFFMALHLVQTLAWYDGLAQDVPEWTSQWSVIILLAAVLMMENQRRGLAFGHRFGFVTAAARGVRKYHGYYFAWATIYTFWYHPMLATTGHLAGFAYMFLLLLQGSLFFTRAHLNRYWTGLLEMLVVAHAVMVATMNGDGWPMFLTGFVGVFVLTQMHGLGLGLRTRWLLGLGYLAGVIAIYAPLGFEGVWRVPLIPFTEVASVLVLSGLVLAATRLIARVRRPAASREGAPAKDLQPRLS